ncbi:MAG: tetratricopeptide repeat protein [Bdellovibrionota bacterium]
MCGTLSNGMYKSLIFALLVFSCSHGENTRNEDLDIALQSTNGAEAMKKNEDSPSVISPSSVIRWQNFFKASPSIEQRKLIEKKLINDEKKDSIDILLKKARNEMAIGRYSQAEASYREILHKNSENLESILELASLYLRKKNLDRVFEFLSQLKESLVVMEQPDSAFVFRFRYTLALAYIARGDRAKGHKILSDLIALDKSFTPGYAALASSYANEGKYNMARFIAMRGLDRGNEHPALYNILGVVSEYLDTLESAEKWYNKAHDLSPTFAPVLVNRANLNIKRFDYKAAEEDLIKALRYDEINLDGLISLAIIKKKDGQYDASRSLLNKAIEFEPENAKARFNLAVLMADSLNNESEAVRLFQEVVQIENSSGNLSDIAAQYLDDIKGSREAY